ncbi:hypothetical protein N656DRAFT_404699 [Canariomyces notabilis]|uniref:Uncharacterized protein n=1 Tax=Canariomyces notabilis TaxID=2074819 RepID=A0AAN6TKS1_9PEZI|nr:hypothetical protein N656DRAFT_404699 [Canariomyces arenarius]
MGLLHDSTGTTATRGAIRVPDAYAVRLAGTDPGFHLQEGKAKPRKKSPGSSENDPPCGSSRYLLTRGRATPPNPGASSVRHRLSKRDEERLEYCRSRRSAADLYVPYHEEYRPQRNQSRFPRPQVASSIGIYTTETHSAEQNRSDTSLRYHQ